MTRTTAACCSSRDETQSPAPATDTQECSMESGSPRIAMGAHNETFEEGRQGGRIDQFFEVFRIALSTPGFCQILILCALLSYSIGCTLGVIPDVMADRYARLQHGYDGPDCASFDRIDKPVACQQGADEAQSAVAWATCFQNILTLFSSTTVGSVSDARGRRYIMILSMFLSMLSPAVLVAMQIVASLDPVWYFITFAIIGFVNFVSIGFSMLSDIVPPDYRAPSFGIFLASWYFGFATSPSMILLMNQFQVSLLSAATSVVGFLFCCFFLPETLPEEVAERNLAERLAETTRQDRAVTFRKTVFRPITEMSILNRDTVFRLLTVAYFFSGMVFSSDRSLVIFYIEDQLNVRENDLAPMILSMSFVAVVVQGFLIELLLLYLGEKGLLVASFACGTLHNLCYGLATSKALIYVAFSLSQFTKTNFPLVSSIASNNVGEDEQGRMQGALFAVSSLANALGPLALEVVYNYTKDGSGLLGPGTMWIVASLLYAVGTGIVCFIPADKTKAASTIIEEENDLEERLLQEQVGD